MRKKQFDEITIIEDDPKDDPKGDGTRLDIDAWNGLIEVSVTDKTDSATIHLTLEKGVQLVEALVQAMLVVMQKTEEDE